MDNCCAASLAALFACLVTFAFLRLPIDTPISNTTTSDAYHVPEPTECDHAFHPKFEPVERIEWEQDLPFAEEVSKLVNCSATLRSTSNKHFVAANHVEDALHFDKLCCIVVEGGSTMETSRLPRKSFRANLDLLSLSLSLSLSRLLWLSHMQSLPYRM